MKTILNIDNGNGASAYYRCRLPGKYCRFELEQSGIRLETFAGTVLGDYPDVLVQHSGVEMARLFYLDACKVLGHRTIVWELDDHYWSSDIHPDLRDGARKAEPALNRMLDLADWLIVSTPALAAVLNRPERTIVCPNLLDARTILPLKDRRPGPVRIVWSGTWTHSEDVRLAYPALAAMIRAGHDVTFFGLEPQGLPGARYVPPCDLKDYHATLAGLAPDIMIAPLRDTPFNGCKTAIKWLEATAVGAAFVGSSLTPYDCVNHGEDGLLADDEFWEAHLAALCASQERREALVASARKRLPLEFCWQGPARMVWLDAFRRIAAVG